MDYRLLVQIGVPLAVAIAGYGALLASMRTLRTDVTKVQSTLNNGLSTRMARVETVVQEMKDDIKPLSQIPASLAAIQARCDERSKRYRDKEHRQD